MKKALLTGAALFALTTAANADAITVSATVDGSLVSVQSSLNGTLNVNNQSFGPIYNLNSLSINSETFLSAPDLLSTNTLDINQNTATGAHQLIIDILATGLSGPNALTLLLSSFSVTGMTQPSILHPIGWTAREQTFINGVQLADTGVFTQTSDSAFSLDPFFLGNTFNAEVRYTINSNGLGRFNGGIDISAIQAAVPEPSTWAMMLLGFVGLAWMGMCKRKSGWRTSQFA